MSGSAYFDADHMHNRTDDTSQHKCQNDQFPAKEQSTGCHQFHITTADRTAAAYQEQNFKETADTYGTDQMRNKVASVKDSCCNTKDKQEYIDSKRNLIGAPVNQTKGQQSRHHQAVLEADPCQSIDYTYQYIENTIEGLYDWILRRNF